jgi:hypothetical protein
MVIHSSSVFLPLDSDPGACNNGGCSLIAVKKTPNMVGLP